MDLAELNVLHGDLVLVQNSHEQEQILHDFYYFLRGQFGRLVLIVVIVYDTIALL